MVCAYTASIVNLKETRKQVINYLAQLMTPSRSVSPSWCARKRGIIVPAHPETNPCSFYAIFFLTMVLVQKRCVLHGVGEFIVCIRWLRTCIFRKKSDDLVKKRVTRHPVFLRVCIGWGDGKRKRKLTTSTVSSLSLVLVLLRQPPNISTFWLLV